MRSWLALGLVLLGWIVVTRTEVGIRIGNLVRAWSDRAMLTLLRLTSEFEREARST